MRPYLFLILVSLFTGCASRVAGPAPPQAQRSGEIEEQAPAKSKIKIENIEDLKNAISLSLTSAERERMAFSCHNDDVSRKIADMLMPLFPRSYSLDLAGIGNLPPEEALSQIDPKSTSALVYIYYVKAGDLHVLLSATENPLSRDLALDYEYNDAIVASAPSNLGELDLKARTAVCDNSGLLYVSDGEKVLIAGTGPDREQVTLQAPCPDPKLYCLDDVVSLYCPSALKGISFTKKGDLREKSEITSFPLPARAARFIYAEKDMDGKLSLFDKRDEKLGSFTDLCMMNYRETTVFAGLSPEGDIWGLRGDLISVMPTVLKGPYKNIVSGGRSIFALSEEGKISQISLRDDFEWDIREIKVKNTQQPVSLAFRGGSLLIFYPRGDGSTIFSVNIPSDRSGGE